MHVTLGDRHHLGSLAAIKSVMITWRLVGNFPWDCTQLSGFC
jgi:hypothetical protein